MTKVSNKFSIFIPQAKAIADLFYPFAEVTIHDTQSNKIVAIFNNYSNRKAGDDSLLDEEANWNNEPEVTEVYEKINYDGRRLKSITSILRDKKSHCPIGLMCINFDISEFTQLSSLVENITSLSKAASAMQPKAIFKNDWQEKINRFVQDYAQKAGLQQNTLTRSEKKKIVQLLKDEGAFKVKHAASHVASVLSISRATVYQYLKEQD